MGLCMSTKVYALVKKCDSVLMWRGMRVVSMTCQRYGMEMGGGGEPCGRVIVGLLPFASYGKLSYTLKSGYQSLGSLLSSSPIGI